MSTPVNIRDINPLEHITSDLSKAMHNYAAILNGLVTWNASDANVVTVRLATDNLPGFVDYTFPTRKSFAGKSDIFASYASTNKGCFAVDTRLNLPVARGGDARYADSVTLRLTASDAIDYSWELYEDVDIHEESDVYHASMSYLPGSYVISDGTVRIVNINKAAGDTLDDMPTQYQYWVSYKYFERGTLTIVDDVVYLLVGYNGLYRPGEEESHDVPINWIPIGSVLDSNRVGMMVETGKAYLYWRDSITCALYIYCGKTTELTADGPFPSSTSHDVDPVDNPWYGPVALLPVCKVTHSTVIRHTPTTDLRGFMLRSLQTGMGESNVYVMANLALRGHSTEPHKGLKIFNTANYVQWPKDTAQVWRSGQTYTYGGDSYVAKMVFNHADGSIKSTNIINYDGPDLDKGLCIYLPVLDSAADGIGNPVESKPKDGATIEFMFRIWPNTALNGRDTADLIVNKAQIYVYTAPSADDLSGAKIIAKFSMARVTNFYIWAENVAIPNRPVFYKAKFIFSEAYNEWKTYDYYQIPDHVFLAPKGFVDPSLRLYADDGFYPGLETAGFPLMQDPFGGLDLSRIRLNRIEEDEPVVPEPTEESSEEETEPGE